jgi:hypothetical protein
MDVAVMTMEEKSLEEESRRDVVGIPTQKALVALLSEVLSANRPAALAQGQNDLSGPGQRRILCLA